MMVSTSRTRATRSKEKEMSKRNKFWLGAVLAISMTTTAFADDVTAETVVATVNGTDITLGHMIATREALPEQYQNLEDGVLFEGILDQLIQQTVLSQSLKGPAPKRIDLAIDNERRTLRAGIVLDDLISSAVSDEALQAAYEERFANAEPTTEYNASHILVETEAEAQEIRKLLDDGADFAALAKEKSTGPSGPNGGNLGWFGPGMMVKPFEDAVVVLEPGQVSDPIETQFGWHVILLSETRLKDAPALEEVRSELEANIQRDAVEDTITTLTDEAAITRVENGSIPASKLRESALLD